jgi:hypothetical protein
VLRAGQHLTFFPKDYFPEDNTEFRDLRGHATEVISGPHEVSSQGKPTPAYIVRLSSTSAPDGGDLIVAYEHELRQKQEKFTALERLNIRYTDSHLGRGMTARVNGVIHNGEIITAMRKHASDPVYGVRLDNDQMTVLHGTVFLDRVRSASVTG